MEVASALLGARLLKGYSMLEEHCLTCGTPLVRDRSGNLGCCLSDVGLCTGAEASSPVVERETPAVASGLSAEEAALAFAEAESGIRLDEEGGPSARGLVASTEEGFTSTDELMQRALAMSEPGAIGAHESKEDVEDGKDLRDSVHAIRQAQAVARARYSSPPTDTTPQEADAVVVPAGRSRMLPAPDNWASLTDDQLHAVVTSLPTPAQRPTLTPNPPSAGPSSSAPAAPPARVAVEDPLAESLGRAVEAVRGTLDAASRRLRGSCSDAESTAALKLLQECAATLAALHGV
jgi:uncharacterized Zn finger protein (UPF0148 family)